MRQTNDTKRKRKRGRRPYQIRPTLDPQPDAFSALDTPSPTSSFPLPIWVRELASGTAAAPLILNLAH